MRSSLAPLVLYNVGRVLAAKDVMYHYMPVEFEYGADSRVTANLTFGTADTAEPVKVVMDSGSANFWVSWSFLFRCAQFLTKISKIWSPGAVVHWGSQYLGVVGPCNETVPTSYDPILSPTSSLINHTSGYAYAGNAKIVSGIEQANDTITAVGGSGPIPNIRFSLENYGLFRLGDNGSCVAPPYDKAILGLSPYTNNTVGPSFRQTLYETGQVASKTMFMWFDAHSGALGDLFGGVLFGAIDTSKYTGSLVEVANVVDRNSQVGIYVSKPNITINGQTFAPDQDTTCLMDSGAHADYLPFSYESNMAQAFYDASNGQLLDYNGVVAYNGSCESIPQGFIITYTFAGLTAGDSVNVSVPVRNYARGLVDPYNTQDICLLNLEEGGCMFGAPFQSAAAILLDDEGDRVALSQGAISKEVEGVDEQSLVILGEGVSWDSI